jgi:hypothetical protein
MPLTSILTIAIATVGFGFLLRSYLLSNNVIFHQFVRPHLVINAVLFVFFLFLLVFLIVLAGISPHGEVAHVLRVITNGSAV